MPSVQPIVDHTRPLLTIFVLWHPDFVDGETMGRFLFEHYRRKLYESVAGGAGVSVVFRSVPVSGGGVPLEIDFDDSELTAIVVLIDKKLSGDKSWISYVKDLARRTDEAGLSVRLFPVSMEAGVLQSVGLDEQALRWDSWGGTKVKLRQRLLNELNYELCRMLRHYIEHLDRPSASNESLMTYLKKVQVFISHSKHDDDGVRVARKIRDAIHDGHGLASFFDVHDIPAGLKFNTVLLHQVKVSAVIAVHTDSYSSREWCRRELLEAKRHNVPLIVANCINDWDERGFPYMGNVPVVRLDPFAIDRIDVVVGRLLDEVLKDFLWRCRIQLLKCADPDVFFMSRPPELISLVTLPSQVTVPAPIVVHPDPPLSAEEERLFEEIAPHVRIRSLTEWLAGAR